MFQTFPARKGRLTRRSAPPGYVAVDKNLARQLFDAGESVTLCGNNVNSFHVFNGWHLGCTLASQSGEAFDAFVRNFLFYLEPELGTYPVFYVSETVLQRENPYGNL